ncbi:MAG: hypothetical protein A2946_01485 [Candidatus Liptonbacteria bacterium RIFCSPLOWO2_01_FULL_53_13]|uniref:Uncharacterized protein n=1 Tax=Candidatus Liptonbacteria bacterium RIFCSPLOWO2_01_FULL_53_13 TaxID=1798651 RepID=A0A1G2CJQ4_9BACT|nr:MAG: hypothetical protein A2946_01485 [Candidatus Liptonbacteria bacterium RIFCSPLOWO2_01_FULL_53_13]
MTGENDQKMDMGEVGPERVLSLEEILSQLRSRCESFEVERELGDAEGIYLLEVKSLDGSKRFTYQRKRLLPGQPQGIESAGTTIRIEWLDDGFSKTLADFNPTTGEWVEQ